MEEGTGTARKVQRTRAGKKKNWNASLWTKNTNPEQEPRLCNKQGGNGKPWLRFNVNRMVVKIGYFCRRIHTESKKHERKSRRFMKQRNILLILGVGS